MEVVKHSFYHFCCLNLHLGKPFFSQLGGLELQNFCYSASKWCHHQETISTAYFHAFCFTKVDRSGLLAQLKRISWVLACAREITHVSKQRLNYP